MKAPKSKFGNFETTTHEGAMRLCEMIRAYWADQGLQATAWPVLMSGRSADNGSRVWTVKSNIVITRFDAPIPDHVQRTAPLESCHYLRKPRKEAA